MLKMYRQAEYAGATNRYWEEKWEKASAALAGVGVTTTCENSPLWRELLERAEPDRLFMDGGCGLAQWVKYFHGRGYAAVGFDLAEETVRRLKDADETLDVRVGDVRDLPLDQDAVHVYYSGGVVEHFEEGPMDALREARRVVANDGWFLCSVPDSNWLRRKVLFRRAKPDRMVESLRFGVRSVDATQFESAPDGWAFHQYAFTRDEFTTLLERVGFRVVKTFGYSVVWGLYDLPGFERLYNAAWRTKDRLRRTKRPKGPEPEQPRQASAPPGILKRVLVREDQSVPIAGAIMARLSERVAHMRMYVASSRA